MDLPYLQRAQYAAQSRDSTGVAACLIHRFLDKLVAAPIPPLGEDALCIRPHLVSRDVTHIGGEPSQEPLDDVGMQLRFEVRPMNLRAAQNPLLKEIFLLGVFEAFGDVLEVLANFFVNATLGMARIVTGKAVAATAP